MIAPAEICLDEYADGERSGRSVFLFFHRDLARRRSGSTLEFITNHPGSAANTSLFDRAAVRVLKRAEDMLPLHVKAVHVVQPTVPCFGHDRQAPVKAAGIRAAFFHAPTDDRVTHDANTMRVCNCDRSFQESAFLHPRSAGHFAVSIEAEDADINRIVGLAARQNRSHTGPDRPFADLEFALAADERRVTDLNAGDVSDRVEFSRRSIEGNAKRSRAHVLRWRRRGLRLAGEKPGNEKNGERESGEA